MLEEHCHREGFKQLFLLQQVQFTDSGHVSLSLEPDNILGWNWSYCGVCSEYVSNSVFKVHKNFYKIMKKYE